VHYTGPTHNLENPHYLKTKLDDGVLSITLMRPEQGNAINIAMTREIDVLLNAVHHDAQVRVVVLRGEGTDFCVGLDNQDFLDTARHPDTELSRVRDMHNNWRLRRLRLLPQPVIAMIHGTCQGEAIGILEGCDIVFAAEDAQFRLTGDRAPALSGGSTMKTLSRVMAPRAASFHSLTGKAFDGKEAERNGLITLAFPYAQLEAEVYSLARDMVEKDSTALQFTKETLLYVGDMSWDAVLNFTAAKFAELKMIQAGKPSTRASAIEKFLSGQSKPGLGG
jgi:enoyl-CoA hydratase/carnithine racemase